MSSDIIASRKYTLGDIELETSHTAGQLLQLGAQGRQGPSGWNLSALAVAISASMEIARLREELADVRCDLSTCARVLLDREGYIEKERAAELRAMLVAAHDPLPEPGDLDLDNVTEQLVRDTTRAAVRAGGLTLVEPTPEALADDYARRLAAAQVLAAAGAGWPEVVAFAFHPSSKLDLQRRDRDPTPTELRTIEKWLNQNAKKGPAL